METYFKLLKAIEGGDRPLKDHNLLELFKDLSEGSREMLDVNWLFTYSEEMERVKWMRENAPPGFEGAFQDRTLFNALNDAQMAFMALRYADGVNLKGKEFTRFAAYAVPDFLRGRILDLRPDLKPPPESGLAKLDHEPGEPQVAKGHYKQTRFRITYS